MIVEMLSRSSVRIRVAMNWAPQSNLEPIKTLKPRGRLESNTCSACTQRMKALEEVDMLLG